MSKQRYPADKPPCTLLMLQFKPYTKYLSHACTGTHTHTHTLTHTHLHTIFVITQARVHRIGQKSDVLMIRSACAFVYTCMHARARTHTHARTHTCIHTHKETNKQILARTHTRAHTHTFYETIRFVTPNTVEEKILAAAQRKLQVDDLAIETGICSDLYSL